MASLRGAVQVATSDTGNRTAIWWMLGTFLAVSLTSGCNGTHPAMIQGTTTVGTDLYQVGPLRVLLRPQPEVEFMCRLHAQQQATPNGRILGCYVPRERAIISTPDAHVLLHEFKHYFEGPFHE
jgi:hypothetical protein